MRKSQRSYFLPQMVENLPNLPIYLKTQLGYWTLEELEELALFHYPSRIDSVKQGLLF